MNIILPLYYECLAPRHRWIGCVTGQGFSTAIGALFPVLAAMLVFDGEKGSWRLVLCLSTLPFLLFIILGTAFLTESPRYLVSIGKHAEAIKLLRNSAIKNGKKLPEKLVLIAERDSEKAEGASFVETIKIALNDFQIIRSLLCIVMIGTATRYISYGMAFIRTELLFTEGAYDNYCAAGANKELKKYLLDTSDYIAMAVAALVETLIVFPIYFFVRHEIPLKPGAAVSLGVAALLTSLLYLCPPVMVALLLVVAAKIVKQGANSAMFLQMAGLYPTRVRTTLFGIGTFVMYMTIPASPYLIQVLSKHSQHLVTTVSLAFILTGFMGAILLPSKIYSN